MGRYVDTTEANFTKTMLSTSCFSVDGSLSALRN